MRKGGGVSVENTCKKEDDNQHARLRNQKGTLFECAESCWRKESTEYTGLVLCRDEGPYLFL